MELKTMLLRDIIPYANNPRNNEGAVDAVAESIRQCGYVSPIIVDENMVILAGHTRYKALEKIGWDSVQVAVREGLTEEQKRKFRILDNKTNELAEWDFDLLNEELDGLDFNGFDFGFDDLPDEPVMDLNTAEDDAYEEQDELPPRAKIGDIWKLGDHRLMCGSSTSAEDVRKLMDGRKAKMLFTSPPYSDMREYEGGKDLSVENIAKFIEVYRTHTDYQCVNLGIQRKNYDVYEYWNDYIAIARKCGYKLLSWNVWDKEMSGNIGQAKAFFPLRHELVFVFGTDFFEINYTMPKKEESIVDPAKMGRKTKRNADGTTSAHTVGDTSKTHKQMESVLQCCPELGRIRAKHPATFPVGLPAEYVKAMSKEGDVIIEPFCGSGTTLIACEQIGRKCYAMELEPKYMDVIIDRWEQMTGKQAVLLNE